MGRDLILGLTTADVGSSLWNNLGYACIGFAGAAAAGITATYVLRLIKSRGLSAFIGGAAGTVASFWLVKYVPYVILPDKTALGFLAIFVISSIATVKMWPRKEGPNGLWSLAAGIFAITAFGGAFAHIGRGTLYVVGFGASFFTSSAMTRRPNTDRDDYKRVQPRSSGYPQDGYQPYGGGQQPYGRGQPYQQH